jgi:hypothetical protein
MAHNDSDVEEAITKEEIHGDELRPAKKPRNACKAAIMNVWG